MLGAESVAISFAPRLLPPPACPSLPRPLSLFCARSVCPPYPFSLLLCFHGSASLSPGLLPVRPGSHAAIPGENLVRPGFSAWRNPASPWAIPGRPGVPSGCRIGPGESGPLPAMDPAVTRGPEGGAAASWPSNGISSGISNGTRGHRGWGEAGRAGGDRARPGFPEQPRGKRPADLRIRGTGSKPRHRVVVFAAAWAAVKDGGGDRWQRPGPSRRTPKAPGDRLSPAEQRH